MNESQIEFIVEAIKDGGRFVKAIKNEYNTRCPFCGDSRKSSKHAHFYINAKFPHKCYCQRCNYSSSYITPEILDAFQVLDGDARVYARDVVKHERKKSNRGKNGPKLKLGGNARRLIIPDVDRANPDDLRLLKYIEDRLKSGEFTPEEIQRYKIITCGLYAFLEGNGINWLTVKEREADFINDNCIMFLSADETYLIARNTNPEINRRYVNYSIYESDDGSKSFSCRSNIDAMTPVVKVVQSEGIIDLIQIERLFYREQRWSKSFIGIATNGARHDTVLRQLFSLGLINIDLDLHIDKEPGSKDKALHSLHASPFLQSEFTTVTTYWNTYDGEKDFGTDIDKIQRTKVKLDG